MTLKKLKNNFRNTLDSFYPKEEIESFYFLLIDNRLNLKRIDIALSPTKKITPSDEIYFNDCLEKLTKQIPIQYIIGNTEFFGLPFNVDKNVLIPRPETEGLVDWIIASTPPCDQLTNNQKPTTILDVGTGSGCIAVALAKNLQNTKVYALDVSKEALVIAKQNAKLNKVSILFIEQDILTSTPLSQQFDIIVSNPPYVRELEKAAINKNVLENEPHLALFVDDNNPLLFYDKIADLARENLKPNGQLFFEINQYLGKKTVELLKQKGFTNIELRKDIFKNDRMIKATNFK